MGGCDGLCHRNPQPAALYSGSLVLNGPQEINYLDLIIGLLWRISQLNRAEHVNSSGKLLDNFGWIRSPSMKNGDPQ